MTVKKAELHVHLEGTISPILAKKLALRNQCVLPESMMSDDGEGYVSRDFLHFLSVYDVLSSVIKTPQDYYDLTYDYLRSSACEGVIYTEMMYSPEHAEKMSGIPSKEHLEALQKAVDDAEKAHGIVGRILITMVRQFGADAAMRVVQEAIQNPPSCVVGFGLGGDELGFPPQLFQKAFQLAASTGLSCTAHTGEFAPAGGMLDALNFLPLTRIGHGVQAIHSPEVMSIIKDRGITLELCPSSNIKFGLFKDMSEHPLPKFLDAGLKICINSDDPPFIPTTVAKEYERVQHAYGYTNEQMNAMTLMAIDAAFVDESTKKRLRAQL